MARLSPRAEAARRFSAFQPEEKKDTAGGVAVVGGSTLIGALLGTLSGAGPVVGAKTGASIGGALAGLFGGQPQQAAAATQLAGGGISGIDQLIKMFRERQAEKEAIFSDELK